MQETVEPVPTTSRVMAANRRYGEFYDFYSVSPEYFGYTFVRNEELCLAALQYPSPIQTQNVKVEYKTFKL
jgi:hypothetical protein